MIRYNHFIDGKSTVPSSGRWFDTDNPYRGKPWASVAEGNLDDVDHAVTAAQNALESEQWAGMTASERGLLLYRIADVLEGHASRLAELETRDNGKLVAEMRAQTAYLPAWYRYYGGLADKVEGTVPPIDKAGFFTYTRREPVGVVAILTPWNSPLMLLSWKLAPALAAGCTVVAKPSEFTSASTVRMAELFSEAGLPNGVFNVVTGLGQDVGEPLVNHPGISKVSFTGSEATGSKIGEAAGRDFKHVALELGGKSPNIVFADADLPSAVNGVVAGIFAASGQTCIAGSRLLVQEEIHDKLLAEVVQLASTARMGDPLDATTQVGPITTRPQYAKVLQYIEIAQGEGAQVALGGGPALRPECGDGWFVEPTILSGVDNQMRIAQEEVFGPVLAVIPFRDEEEAIRLANDSRHGLGAGVWTRDLGRAIRVSHQIRSGTVWVNTYRALSYLAPFGGFKASGLGRENGIAAINDYLETKTVWVNTGAPTANPFVIR
ncbi:aldehyde dehydrogenase [Saccharopolyspora karakumensis]|uniref:Aldehyde dehydrogenase n=1 Tax=Saccharopolyspora karakumensis TaxID=2530386 RepID=A0A4R5C1E4_9PSEU|nr:aldehyde dehydrogenase [Saccharopolyspora karakumensis]TDD90532.1 aldehyde dehydrogenase [Saccharopolyspora karakumensis]